MYKCRNLIFGAVFLVLLQARAIELTNLWSFRVCLGCESSPALSPDGILYFGSGDHHLYAVSTNRSVRWTFETGLDIKSSPAIGSDGTIYVGSRDRKFYAVTPQGKLKWSFRTEGWVDSSPAIAEDGTIYFGSWDKTFYALNPNGTKKWVFNTAGEIDSSPAIAADGTIYFGSHDKKLYALNQDGTKKWEFATGGPIISSPAIDFSGRIYFSSVDGKFYALNPDGTLHWSTRTGGVSASSPVLANDGTICIAINKSRATISPDGKVKWRDIGPFSLVDSTPAMAADNTIYYATTENNIVAETSDRQRRLIVPLKFGAIASPVVAPDGMIYVLDAFGDLSAVRGEAGLMQSAWPMFRANPRHTGAVNTSVR